ncbi:MAG: hypothetical protein ABIQ31_02485 [Ferruginibacter sp.]
MTNQIYAGQGRAINTDEIIAHDPADPKQKNRADEIVENENENIVNTEEQNEVLNEQDVVTSAKEESENMEKGYEEGTKNDSLTEPEFRDSDDQPQFPGEEGKQ